MERNLLSPTKGLIPTREEILPIDPRTPREAFFVNSQQNIHQRLLRCCPNVYFQPPSNLQLVYPCIIYAYYNMNVDYADDRNYMTNMGYRVSSISRAPNDVTYDNIMREFKYVRWNTSYIAANLHHNIVIIYDDHGSGLDKNKVGPFILAQSELGGMDYI